MTKAELSKFVDSFKENVKEKKEKKKTLEKSQNDFSVI